MSYEITDTGASIRFISEEGFFYLMKHHIKSIQHVRENMVRIDTGCCLHSIFIQAKYVSIPVNFGGEHLAAVLNNWTTSFLKGFATPPDQGPIE
jgi:hypothetical protein